jgi:hypothetical protein
MAVIGSRNVGTNDLVLMGAGVLMLIDSFLPWYGASLLGISRSSSAWNSGFGAWFSVLLVMVVAGSVAGRVFGGRRMPVVANGAVSWNLICVGASVLALIIILLRWVTYPDAPSGSGISAGAKVGTYIGLIVAGVQAVFGYLTLVAAGERLPWQKRPV